MPTQTLGKVKLTPRGAYDPAATYVPLDIVSYGGGSYCALKNVTGVTPTGDDVNYQLLAESGADGKSPQISASKTWLVWDANKGEYVDTGVSAAGEKGDDGDPGKAPIIGENGNWYEWDDAVGTYTDTGKPSRGEKGETGAAGADGADGRDGITPTIGDNGNWYLGDTDTGKPSRGKDGASGATGATGEKGADGKSAYAYAVEGGYTGTEAEFAAKLAAEKFANPNALTFTGAVTGSYDGSAPLEVAIPSGGGSSDSVVFANDILAEGTVSSGLAAWSTVDTGVTPQELRAYKSFAIYYFGMTGRTYATLCGKSLGQLTNILLFEWEDSAKTILRLIAADNGKTNLFHKDYREELTNPTYQSPLCPSRTDFRNATDDNLKFITSQGTTTEATYQVVGWMK